MKNYALKRLLQLIPILLAITFLSYGMMRIAGSDVVEQKMENTSGTVSQEMIDNARAELGLDKPFVVQYFTWLGNLTWAPPTSRTSRCSQPSSPSCRPRFC